MPVVINEWVAETAPEAEKAAAEPAKDDSGAPPNPRAIETIMRRVHDRHARIRE
jgi:hypothetical protein